MNPAALIPWANLATVLLLGLVALTAFCWRTRR